MRQGARLAAGSQEEWVASFTVQDIHVPHLRRCYERWDSAPSAREIEERGDHRNDQQEPPVPPPIFRLRGADATRQVLKTRLATEGWV